MEPNDVHPPPLALGFGCNASDIIHGNTTDACHQNMCCSTTVLNFFLNGYQEICLPSKRLIVNNINCADLKGGGGGGGFSKGGRKSPLQYLVAFGNMVA